MRMRIGVVVLASGESRRFQGGNKLLAPFGGKPLIAHTLLALQSTPPLLPFEQKWVVTRSAEVARLAQALGFEPLLHQLPNVSDTIRLGIEAMQEMDGCLFCVGDQPFLNANTIYQMLSAFAQFPQSMVRVSFGERVGNPVLFPKALFHELASLKEGQSGGTVIKRHAASVKCVQASQEEELQDIDTYADYEQLLKKECDTHAAHR
ncbi:MAG: nucleotidyltransferase family protein [Clostridia bacterium]